MSVAGQRSAESGWDNSGCLRLLNQRRPVYPTPIRQGVSCDHLRFNKPTYCLIEERARTCGAFGCFITGCVNGELNRCLWG